MRWPVMLLIKAYRYGLSPLLGSHCRFHPSCSQYAETAVARFGVLRGGWLAVKRLARCHPWHEGGVDPVPGRFEP
jgi:putative membrane protein insertion efficiency factor